MTHAAHADDIRVRDAIARVIAEAGIPAVLGMPGGYIGGIVTACELHPRIRAMLVRQESVGTIMAEAYGRLTGKPLVVLAQGEWIVGNAAQGLLEALLGSSPIVVLTEMTDNHATSHHAPYQAGTGDYGAWDAQRALSAVCKRVMVSHTPAQAVQHTQLAIKHATTGNPGPVAVIYRREALRGSVKATDRPVLFPTAGYLPDSRSLPPPGAIAAAAAAIASATNPSIIAGNGVRVGQATSALARFAAHIDAPIATTAGGKGVYPEALPLSAGIMGEYGHRCANELLGASDLIIAIGTRLATTDTCGGDPRIIDVGKQTLIQIDIEPLHLGWTLPVDHALCGDATLVMDALIAAGCGRSGNTAAPRIADARSRFPTDPGRAEDIESFPIPPEHVLATLQRLWPDSAIATCDAGENRLFMMHWFKSTSPGGYLQPTGGGGMGSAVPSALGAKLAFPDRAAIAVCGDGGFTMSFPALMTAVQHQIPIGVVILNNATLGWVKHGARNAPCMEQLGETDYAGIARAMGARAIRVTSPAELAPALAELFRGDGPIVIDVPVSMDTSYNDVRVFPPKD